MAQKNKPHESPDCRCRACLAFLHPEPTDGTWVQASSDYWVPWNYGGADATPLDHYIEPEEP